jgi:hypothetical protein
MEAMKKHRNEIDVFVHGGACLQILLEGSHKPGEGQEEEERRAADCIANVTKCGGIETIADGMRLFPTCEICK